MTKSTISIFLICLFLVSFSTSSVLAHPGNTAADGCHYCRTRCGYWGVAWNQRHCHGGYSPPSTYIAPVTTPVPTPTPTPRPTFIPISTPKETPIPISTPTLSPGVKGESVKDAQSAEEPGDSGSGMLLPLGTLGLAGGYWFYKKRVKRKRESGL